MEKLHLGCFDRAVDGWVNTDVTPHLFVARIPGAARVIHALGRMTDERYAQHRRGVFDDVQYLNLGRRFPYRRGRFDVAFSAHVLEHLYRDQARLCVREVHRVLKPGGLFRVTVPDLDQAVRAYDPSEPDVLNQLMYESHQRYDKNRHHWMYNEHSLRRLLEGAGFVEVQRRAYMEGDCPDLDRLDNRPEGTLFMEARKAG